MQSALLRAELQSVVEVWLGVCVAAARITPHCAGASAWRRGSYVQVVVLHLVLLHEGRPGQVVVEPRSDLVAPRLELLLLALGCIILPTNTLLSDLSLRCVPLLEQLLQGVVSLGGSFFRRQL